MWGEWFTVSAYIQTSRGRISPVTKGCGGGGRLGSGESGEGDAQRQTFAWVELGF